MSPKTKAIVIKILRALVWIVYAWVAITIVLLFLAFLLQLLGADPSAGFVEFIYRSTARAMAPFRGIFESVPLSDNSVLDISILFAIIVYSFVALGARHRPRLGHRKAANRAGRSPLRRRARGPAGGAAAGDELPRCSLRAAAALPGPLCCRRRQPARTSTSRRAGWTRAAGTRCGRRTRAGVRTSAGTFQPSPAGATKLGLTSPMTLAETRSFGVSLLGLSDEALADVLVGASRLTTQLSPTVVASVVDDRRHGRRRDCRRQQHRHEDAQRQRAPVRQVDADVPQEQHQQPGGGEGRDEEDHDQSDQGLEHVMSLLSARGDVPRRACHAASPQAGILLPAALTIDCLHDWP